MNILGQSVFLKALGWALLDSIWQFGLLSLIMLVFLFMKKELSSRYKHGLALLLLVTGAGWFLVRLLSHYNDPGALAFDSNESLTVPNIRWYADLYIAFNNLVESNINYISVLYLLVVSVLSMRFFRYFYQFQKVKTTGITKLRAGLRMQVQLLAERLGISRKVQVWVSSYVDTPMIIGFLKPTILLPVASLNFLSVQQLEAILLHELAHIKRNDYVINLFVITMEIAFFFNPFARLLIRLIKQERENSCDDWVLQFRFNPHQYASALLALEQGRSSYLSAAIGATGKSKKRLLHRVQRIMQVEGSKSSGLTYILYFAAGIILMSAVFLNAAQSRAKEPRHSGNIKSSPAAVVHSTNQSVEAAPLVYLVSNATPKKVAKKTIITRSKQGRPGTAVAVSPDPLSLYIRSIVDQNDAPATRILAAFEEPEKEFSIAENESAELPSVPSNPDFPFVPGSSFSYNITDDTTRPKVKNESYQERIARESLAKAKLAINRIDWNKIGKQLKSKTDVLALRKELEHSLEQLNWKQINEEVRSSIDKEAIEDLKSSLENEYKAINRFKLQQEQYRFIQKELKQQQERYQKDAEKQLIDIQLRNDKKVTVHI